MKSLKTRRSKLIILFILLQILSVLTTGSLLIAKLFVDIDWLYVFLPVIITFGLPTILILSIISILLIFILIFGKSKGIKDIRKVIKNKKDE